MRSFTPLFCVQLIPYGASSHKFLSTVHVHQNILFSADYGWPMGEWSYWIRSHQHYRFQDRRFIKTIRKGFPGGLAETWPNDVSGSGPGFYLGRFPGSLSVCWHTPTTTNRLGCHRLILTFSRTAFRKVQNKYHCLGAYVCGSSIYFFLQVLSFITDTTHQIILVTKWKKIYISWACSMHRRYWKCRGNLIRRN